LDWMGNETSKVPAAQRDVSPVFPLTSENAPRAKALNASRNGDIIPHPGRRAALPLFTRRCYHLNLNFLMSVEVPSLKII
jgi:hypothetical protein